jgi:hypothetical protein
MDMRMDVRTATGEILEVLPVTWSTYYPLELLDRLIKSDPFTWENKVATLHMPEEFAEFLLHWTHGPKLDEGTVNLLSELMVTNGIDFIQYSIQPFSVMLSQLTVRRLCDLTPDGLRDIKIYGRYLTEHHLVNEEGSIDILALACRDAYTVY